MINEKDQIIRDIETECNKKRKQQEQHPKTEIKEISDEHAKIQEKLIKDSEKMSTEPASLKSQLKMANKEIDSLRSQLLQIFQPLQLTLRDQESLDMNMLR